jgi:thiamine-phosphate pyrophosphorylase
MNRLRGLYAVTPDEADSAYLMSRVRRAFVGGARILQYRNKAATAALRREQATALRALCREFDAALIINDDLELALAVDADGLHLGAEDGSLAAARARLGPGKWLGASCYRSLENAARAIAEGADHIAFGSFFVSTIKPGAVRSTPALLTEAKQKFNVPVVAIGGITLDNASLLIAAGADSVAVITALFGAPDVALAARKFNALFDD